LNWRRMDDKKVSVIGCGKSFDGHNRANWPAMISWLVEHLQCMEKHSVHKSQCFDQHYDKCRMEVHRESMEKESKS